MHNAFITVDREVSLCVYGKTKTLRIAKFIGETKGVEKYTKRGKIEQMIKDLKQQLGFADYQVRDLQAIQRHVALGPCERFCSDPSQNPSMVKG